VKKQGIQHVVQFLADSNFQPKNFPPTFFFGDIIFYTKKKCILKGKGRLQLQIDVFWGAFQRQKFGILLHGY